MAFPSCSSLVWFEPGADTMVWDGGGWRTPCHTVTLLSVTEGTLQSLAELQEAVLQCPVSDPHGTACLSLPKCPSLLPGSRIELPVVLCCRPKARAVAAASCMW